MAEYRWNLSEAAVGYDAAAERIHPYYLEMQSFILDLIPFPPDASILLVDAGGGSGRLMERLLARFTQARGLIVDQSEAFLAIAERRLAAFGSRASFMLERLQNDWTSRLSEAPAAIVSMSAIHHLEPVEKEALYRGCAAALAPGGVLLNGDEVRPADDGDYLAVVQARGDYMLAEIERGTVPPPMQGMLRDWVDRNVTRFSEPKTSGDDCHETAQIQLAYFRRGGLSFTDIPWEKELWAVLRGIKSDTKGGV